MSDPAPKADRIGETAEAGFAPSTGSAAATCKRCDGGRTIRVLGGGGDYEDWPCPECTEYHKPDASEYEDGESD